MLEGRQVAAVVGEGFVQPAGGQRRGGQVLIDPAQPALQQVEGQAPGHRAVALAAHPGAGGDGLAQGQAQVVEGQVQRRALGRAGKRLVLGVVDAVVAAGRDGQLATAALAGQLHQAHMQVATGVQGHRGVFGAQAGSGVGGEHVLLQVAGRQPMVFAQLPAAGDQGRVVLQAGQLLPGLQQAAAEMAFARTPVQPVAGGLGEFQAGGEGFDLLPFTPGYIDVEALAGGRHFVRRQLGHGAQRGGSPRQIGEGRGGIEQLGVVMAGFGVVQAALAQPLGEFAVLGFPGQLPIGEGARTPELLMVEQEAVQGLEAGEEFGVLEDGGHGERLRGGCRSRGDA
ncbi:hypothetical protein EMIT0P201_30232 [Pseudomonas chlororaphis]